MGVLLVLLITVLSLAIGYRLISLVRARLSVWERLGPAALIGLALTSWIGFLAAVIGGLNAITIGVTVFVLVVLWVALDRISPAREVYVELRAAIREFDLRSAIYYVFWMGLLFWLFVRVISFEAGGLFTAPVNNFGDLPFHLSVITSFAWGDNYPPVNPIFAGSRFTYPFLIDFLTAFFLRAGAGWRIAFLMENLILAIALVGIVETLSFRLTGNRLAARLTPFIFLFSGGFGFLNFFSDLANAGSIFEALTNLPRTYTMNTVLPTRFGEVPIRWGNPFTTLLIPQRSLLFGLPLVGIILTLWHTALRETTTAGERRRLFLAAGILAGAMPFLHAHSFFAVIIASLILLALFWSFDWVAFFVPAFIISIPQALYLMGTPVRDELFAEHLGWESGTSSALLFWLANAGPFIFLLIAALTTRGLVEPRTRRFYFAFLIWFVLPNVVLLAPWPWDNIKILICWSLVSAPFVALVLADGFARNFFWKAASAALLLILVFSGALDVARALTPVEKVNLLGPAEIQVAELIKAKTEPDATIAHIPIHNSAVILTGRQSLMGYPGHLWSHGINYQEREADVQKIFREGPAARVTMKRYGIDYLLVGPLERRQFNPDEKALAAQFPVVFDHAEYRLYDVRK